MDINTIIAYVISILITAGIGFLVELLRRKVGLEGLRRISWQLDQKKDLAMLAVQFTEQAYKDMKGQDKYNYAAKWLAARAKEHGIQISDDEIKGLIEATLRQIKDQLGDEWAKAMQEEEPAAEEAG
ncbi:MAG: phage holin, LLH family [Syntrophomonadaceae bacterium]|jgi:FKBP-type peptidyl-prolyl cis-trans isomerase (trigger factor)